MLLLLFCFMDAGLNWFEILLRTSLHYGLDTSVAKNEMVIN